MLNSRQRAYLKSLASTLDPILQIGKSGLTPEMPEAVAEAFNTRELIKVSILKNCLEEPNEVARTISERTHSQLVHVIGRKFVLYKESKEHKKIELPK